MDAQRKLWNENHQLLRQKLPKALDFAEMKALLLRHHASVHTAALGGDCSFEDEVWQSLNEADARCIPAQQEHSIIWIFWHIARIEDLTMNLLLAGQDQLFHRGNWREKIGLPFEHTGNEISPADMVILNQATDLSALRAYRQAVGQETQAIIQHLSAEILPRRVDANRIQQVRASGAVLPAATGIIDYWSKRSVADLLLMPPTRHNFLHINEALRIKAALKRK